MYDDLIKRLREASKMSEALAVLLPNSDGSATAKLYNEAADAIEKLEAELSGLRIFYRNISELPDCNTCFKKGMCEFLPRYGDYARINCPHWLGEPPKEE